jgi:hypothetical protein
MPSRHLDASGPVHSDASLSTFEPLPPSGSFFGGTGHDRARPPVDPTSIRQGREPSFVLQLLVGVGQLFGLSFSITASRLKAAGL